MFRRFLCVCVSAQLHPTLCAPHGLQPTSSSVYAILQARILKWLAISSPEDLPQPGIEAWPLALQADSLPSEPPGFKLPNL